MAECACACVALPRENVEPAPVGRMISHKIELNVNQGPEIWKLAECIFSPGSDIWLGPGEQIDVSRELARLANLKCCGNIEQQQKKCFFSRVGARLISRRALGPPATIYVGATEARVKCLFGLVRLARDRAGDRMRTHRPASCCTDPEARSRTQMRPARAPRLANFGMQEQSLEKCGLANLL